MPQRERGWEEALRTLRREQSARQETELAALRLLREQLQAQLAAYRGCAAPEPAPAEALAQAWAAVQRTHAAWRAAMDVWQQLTRAPPGAAHAPPFPRGLPPVPRRACPASGAFSWCPTAAGGQ